jgi:hypothetical protein
MTPVGWEFLPFPKHRPNHRLYPSLTHSEKRSRRGTQHLVVLSTYNMFQHLQGSADNMLSTFATFARPAMPKPHGHCKSSQNGSKKNVQNRLKIASKSLKIAPNRSFLTVCASPPRRAVNISNICRATGRVNIQHMIQYLQVNGVNIQHEQLRRFRQHFPEWLTAVIPSLDKRSLRLPHALRGAWRPPRPG